MGITHVAQVCLNGHLINETYDQHTGSADNYCFQCGAKTITACPNCNTPLRGYYEVEDLVVLGQETQVESYCYHCGSPYPWTEKALTNAKLIIQEESSIPKEQRDALIESLPDVIAETPGTSLASVRINKFFANASEFTRDAFKQFVIEFGCELLLKLIGMRP